MGEAFYPMAAYSNPNSFYAGIDKKATGSDAGILLRDQGKTRFEVSVMGATGSFSNNDTHIKTVTGNYGAEVFSDAIVLENSNHRTNLIDYGRVFKTTGTPYFVIGNSNFVDAGAGLELSYNHSTTQSHITSIEQGLLYRALNLNANGINFNLGSGSVSTLASLSNTGVMNAAGYTMTDGIVDTEQFISLTSTYTLTSQTAAQKLFNSSTNGVSITSESISSSVENVIKFPSIS